MSLYEAEVVGEKTPKKLGLIGIEPQRLNR